MAAAPDDDARRTLAELEAKLRDLERELLAGRGDPVLAEVVEIPGFEAAATPPLPAGQTALFAAGAKGAAPEPVAAPGTEGRAASLGPEQAKGPVAAVDPDALRELRELLGGLRSSLDGVADAAVRVGVHARALADDHDSSRSRMQRTAAAAARAEEAAGEARRLAAAGPWGERDPAPESARSSDVAEGEPQPAPSADIAGGEPEPAAREAGPPEAPASCEGQGPAAAPSRRTRRPLLPILLLVLVLTLAALLAYFVVH